MPSYFVQMSGLPGSGKSTIARELAPHIGAIVLDHDDTKTTILESGVSPSQAGAASYEVIKKISMQLISEGFSVIIDSPCLYKELLEHGQNAARLSGAEFRFIECVVPELAELGKRLRSRPTKRSQMRSLDEMFSHAGAQPRLGRELLKEWSEKMVRPSSRVLQLDTSEPMEECMLKAVAYVSSTSS